MRQLLPRNVDLWDLLSRSWCQYLATTWAVRLVDSLILLMASQLALVARFDSFDEFSSYGVYAVLLGLLLAANIFPYLGLYDRRTLFGTRTILRLGPAWGLVILVLIAIGYATQTAGDVSRIWVVLWFGFGAARLIAWRCAIAWINRWSAEAAGPCRRVAVLGSGSTANNAVNRIYEGHVRDCILLGLFGDDAAATTLPWPRLGNIDCLVAHCRAGLVDEIVIADDGSDPVRIGRWLDVLRQLPVDVTVVPTFGGRYVPLRNIRRLGQLDGISVAERPLSGAKGLAKRVMDIVVALAVIILAAPLMLLVALAIKLDSRGPVFFRQTRFGFNDEKIEVLKFRTMRVHGSPATVGELRQATRDDPRVTRVGRLLRRSSLDEFPQFFQVLSGKMSVVGPRPHAVLHHHQYVDLIASYNSRHRVKPGITGWAQVNGWRGETTTMDMMEKRVEYDIDYIENWSIFLDLSIIFKTVIVGMVGKNAY
jgi:putative colanic acid biosynthesis UDP-glucose lipid carrier transferase